MTTLRRRWDDFKYDVRYYAKISVLGAGLFLFFAFCVVASAWSFMIIVGIAHAEWWSVIPTMSFKTALLIVGFHVIVGIIVKCISEYITGLIK